MLAEDIKKAMIEYHMTHISKPKTLTMSKETETLLFDELKAYSSVTRRIGDRAMKLETFYGMEIVENNDLPLGMFVVGGVICKANVQSAE